MRGTTVSGHVLLVDDDPDIRLIARMALERVGGLQVTEAADANEALTALTRERPDAVVLDVMLPGRDGPATLAALRELPAGADVDVVFLTATAGRDELDRLRGLGVRGVLHKPFDPMTLADELRRLLGWP